LLFKEITTIKKICLSDFIAQEHYNAYSLQFS